MQYFGYLRRDANTGPDTDFSGYNFWLQKLNSFNGNFRDAEMVKAFLVSGEYRGRSRGRLLTNVCYLRSDAGKWSRKHRVL